MLLAATVVVFAGSAQAETVTVFAPASLTDAMTAVGDAYAAQADAELRFGFASSSTLARQIEAGAPAQIIVSADERWMDHLEVRGLIEPCTRVSPIGNRLVLIAAEGHELAGPNGVALVANAGRVAVGDPEHVPAGRYAQQALESLGLWATVEPRLARADNVRGALALVARAEAPLGVVYATDAAVVPEVDVVATFPPGSHTPIAYPFAIIAGEYDETVQDAFSFLTSDEALAVYRRFGFVVD